MEHHYITLNGKTQTLTEWCREKGIDVQLYYQRKRKGVSDEEALRPMAKPRVTKKVSLRKLAEQNGITLQTYYRRRKKGMGREEALRPKRKAKPIPPKVHRKTQAEICREHGISVSGYKLRISKGMTPEEALTTPKFAGRRKTI